MTWLIVRRVLGFVGAHWQLFLIATLVIALGGMCAGNQRLKARLSADENRAVGLIQRSTACDAAIKAGGWTPDCSATVQQLAAQAAADADSLKSATAALNATTLATNQAVARAEARGAVQAERTARAQAARDGAPVDGAGLRVYDAERLRQRWGQAQH